MRNLIFPRKENYVVKELDELIEIAAEIQKRPEIQKLFNKTPKEIEKELKEKDAYLLQRLDNHAKTFGFLNMYCYEGAPMTIADVIRNLQALLREDCNKKRQEIMRRKLETEQRYKTIIEKLQISGHLLQFIENAQEYLYFRLYRLDVLFMAGFYARNLLEEIARRMRLSYDEIINLRREEIMDFFTKDIIPDKVKTKERKQGYATLLINGELKIISGKELLELIKELPGEKYEKVEEIEGVIASTGHHAGGVKIVIRITDVDKVKDGDVLVSTMTNPYYVPAMIRCGAIVTDEGGILSHAAIISRELGKPCIIGTNIATKALKDNDIVEVNAIGKKGIVRILRRGTTGMVYSNIMGH